MSILNSKTHVLIDYVNNLYAFVNGASDILNFYKSLGGTITGCSSTINTVTCDDTSKLIPGLTVIKTDGTGSLVPGTKVTTIADSTHFNLSATPSARLCGGIRGMKLLNPGAGYSTPPVITFSPPVVIMGNPAIAYSTISSGYVSTLTIVNQGDGYIAAPTVTIANPYSGSIWTSAGTATLNNKYYYTISGIKIWYNCTQAGVFGTTAPSHTSGEVTNGTAKLTYIGSTATAESFFKGATLSAFMDIASFPRDVDGYLIDIFLVNINTKEEVKIKFTTGNSLCI